MVCLSLAQSLGHPVPGLAALIGHWTTALGVIGRVMSHPFPALLWRRTLPLHHLQTHVHTMKLLHEEYVDMI